MPIFKPNLDKLRDKEDIRGLIDASSYEKDSYIRKRAIQLLCSLSRFKPELRSYELIEAVIAGLSDETDAVRLQAASALMDIGDSQAVTPLIRALENADKSLTRTIINALGNIADEHATSHLISMLKAGDEQTVRDIVKAIRSSKPEEFLPHLIELLDSDDDVVCTNVLEILSEYDDPRAVRALVYTLYTSDKARKMAAMELAKIGWEPENISEQVVFYLTLESWDRIRSLGEDALPIIYDSLAFAGGSIKEIAGIVVEYGHKVIDKLIIQTVEKDNEFRENAIRLMVEMGQPALERLVIALQNEDFFVRNFASSALQKFGLIAVPYVIKHLKNPDSQVRLLAGRILEEIGWEPQTEVEKVYFFIALGEWDKLRELDTDTCEPVIYALKNYSDKAIVSNILVHSRNLKCVSVIAGLLDEDEYAHTAKQGLIALGRRAIMPLVEGLDSGSTQYRLHTAVLLGVIGDEGAVIPLIALLNDTDKSVRLAAIISLGGLGDPRALDALAGFLRSDDTTTRKMAAQSISALDHPGVIEILRRLLRDPEPEIRKIAILSLSEKGDHSAMADLEAVMLDLSDPLRVSAALALKILAYYPEKLEAAVDFHLIHNEHEAIVDLGEGAVPRLIEYMSIEQFSAATKEIISEIGRDAAKYLIPMLSLNDPLSVGYAYETLLKINEKFLTIMDMGIFNVSDVKGTKYRGSPVEPLGMYVHLTHSCPHCSGEASTGRTLAWIASECSSKGYAVFPCNECGTMLKIPSTIFRPSFLAEAKQKNMVWSNSTIGQYSMSRILVPNWGEVIVAYNTCQKVEPMVPQEEQILEEESRIVEVSIDDFITNSRKSLPIRKDEFGTQYLTTVYLLFEGRPLTIEALLDKSAELWGFDTNDRARPKTFIDETESIRKALAGYDETDVPAFILSNFGREIETSSNEMRFEKTLLRVGDGMVFMLGQVEQL